MRIYLSILLILNFSGLFSQPYFDVLSVHGQWSNPDLPSSKDSTNVSTKYLSAELSVPIKIKKDILAISPSYSEFTVSSDFFSKIKMRSALLSLAYVKQWRNEKIKTNFVIIGRSNDDPSAGIRENNLQWGLAILHNIKRKENLKLKFGVYFNAEFFGPFILPLAGIDWSINERLNLFGVLPGSMNLEYALNRRMHIGLAFRSITNSYRRPDESFIRINDNHLKAVVDFNIAKRHVLILEAGHSILRKYKPGIRISGDTTYADFDINNGYLFKIGYAFRIRLNEKGE